MAGESAERGAAIAIVGMAGRFPGAEDVAAFWDNLQAGRESIARPTVEELVATGTAPEVAAAADFVRAKGVLAEADCFDAAFFGIAPRMAAQMDPQHRLFLECAWQALEDAGIAGEAAGRRIGVFAGAAAMSSYYHSHLLTDAATLADADPFQLFLLNQPAALPTQVAWHLDLTGPALAVQTACSTGLAAVAIACQNLNDLQCDAAIAGAVALSLPLLHGYRYQPGSILSADGHCRPFDAAAGGTVPGNGVGAVVLKRLADALADGDRVDAVISGFAMNNDGRAKVGFTAPSVEGQAQVILDALAMAERDPAEVGYLEAHGTATALGDAIEIEALRRAFAGVAAGACALGSVKSNIGHLDAAAGIAGLIKATLALREGSLPPSLHFRRANPELRLADSPFAVVAERRDWPARAGERVAGISSFGVGGTNVHLVIEAPPPASPEPPPPPVLLLPLAAATPEALARSAAELAGRLEAPEAPSLAAAAWTLQSGRRPLRHRLAVAARSPARPRHCATPWLPWPTRPPGRRCSSSPGRARNGPAWRPVWRARTAPFAPTWRRAARSSRRSVSSCSPGSRRPPTTRRPTAACGRRRWRSRHSSSSNAPSRACSGAGVCSRRRASGTASANTLPASLPGCSPSRTPCGWSSSAAASCRPCRPAGCSRCVSARRRCVRCCQRASRWPPRMRQT